MTLLVVSAVRQISGQVARVAPAVLLTQQVLQALVGLIRRVVLAVPVDLIQRM